MIAIIVCTNKVLLIVPFSMCCIPIVNKEIQANNKKNILCIIVGFFQLNNQECLYAQTHNHQDRYVFLPGHNHREN